MKNKTHKEIGNIGEQLTANYLSRHKYKVISRNFSCKYGEIDIIATNEKYIIFVEVKTRGENHLFTPAEAVNISKQRKIMKTAAFYLQKNQFNLQPRFDISEVFVYNKLFNRSKINYIENAFIQEGGYAAF